MNILRIVVEDKLPTDCYKCRLSYDKYDIGNLRCVPMTKVVDTYIENRPSWCPLVMEDECEWKRDKSSKLFLDCTGNLRIKVKGYVYCQACGKRIKYVEEERWKN